MRLALLPGLLFAITLHAQQWNWAASAGGTGNTDFCQGIATDRAGNAYWVGSVSGTADFGCGTLTPGSTVAGFVAKRLTDGSCAWVRGITVGFNQAWAYGIAIDAEDRIYVTGRYNGNATFGNGITLNSLGSDDIFLARYDTAGTCLWARRAGSSGSSDEARGVAVSDDGGVFIAGFSGGTTITFDGITLPNAGNYRQVVIARYDSTGTVQWARASSGNGQSKSCRGISVANGRLFVTGQVGFSAAVLDGVAITPGASGTHLYVLAADLDGHALWARSFGSGDHEGMGISADTLGQVFVAARLWGTMVLPADTLTSASGNDDILVMKLDRDGGYHWARSTGSAQRDLAWDVEADGMGNVLVAAQFNQSIDFFGTPFTALGGEDILIAKLAGDGAVVWAARPSGFQRDVPLCIHRRAVAPHELYFGGYYWGTITYGNTTIDDVLNGDAMLVAGVDTTFHTSTYALPACPGACSGTAHAFTNGQGPFSYLWSSGDTSPVLTDRCPGTYTVEVTDANGQVHTVAAVVGEAVDPGYALYAAGDSLWVTGGYAWQWWLNGEAVAGDQSHLIATSSGAYQALVSDAQGCVWSTGVVQVIVTALAEGHMDAALTAWPNPFAEVVHLAGLRAGLGLAVLDHTGRTLWQGTAPGATMQLALPGLAPGGYLLRTADGAVVRLVK